MHSEPVNILLVDDQPGKLLSYQAILEELGENLLTARSAQEALQTLLVKDVALILLDVGMPELDGFSLAEMIRAHPRFEKTAIIFVSAQHLSDLDRIRGYSAGAVDYVPVPVIPEVLRAKVSIFADLHRKTRQLEVLNRELEARVAERTADLEASNARLQQSEERLQLEARRKDEFLATLAHELRNPLAPILTCVHLLGAGQLEPTARDRTHTVLHRQVTHLVRLVDDLMDLSRISRGVITLQREPLDLSAVVSAAVEARRLKFGQRTLVTTIPPRGPFVQGDAVRLAQVVGNLLDNAEKFTPLDGRVEISLVEEDGSAVFTVSDSGIGIAKEDLERVFDLFVQVDGAKAGRGLGIGLALVRRLVELHGGAVRVHSDGPGQGTQAVVYLPTIVPLQPELARPKRQLMDRKLRFLVVDDNTDAAHTLVDLLRTEGHEATAVNGGLQAIEIGETFAPDVVLLDLGMPEIDGFETARRVRQRAWGNGAALVALTGWGQPADRAKTAAAGFNGHLVKPVELATLMDMVERITS